MTEREQEIVAYLDDLIDTTRQLNAAGAGSEKLVDRMMVAHRDAQAGMLAAVRSFITEGAVRG